MGSITDSLERLSRSVAALEVACDAAAGRIAEAARAADPASVERHARLRSEVLAAISELDQLIGAGSR